MSPHRLTAVFLTAVGALIGVTVLLVPGVQWGVMVTGWAFTLAGVAILVLERPLERWWLRRLRRRQQQRH